MFLPGLVGLMLYSIKNYIHRSSELKIELMDNNDKVYESIKRIEEMNKFMTPNEMRESMGMEPIKKSTDKHMYNCPNCSAPITGDRCEYCGTVFKQVEPTIMYYADNRLIAEIKQTDINSELIKSVRARGFE